MTEQDKDESSGEGGAGFSAGTVAAAAGLGVVAGFAIASLWPKDVEPLSGDEAPIRVKNGSLEIELLYSWQQFTEDEDGGASNGRKWKVKGDPERKNSEYFILVSQSRPRRCPQSQCKVKKLEFLYSDGLAVEFSITGKRTKIKASTALDHPPNQLGLLRYSSAGFIRCINVDGKELCCFDRPDSKLEVVLLDV